MEVGSEFAEPAIVPGSDEVELELVDVVAASIEPKLGGALMKRLATAAPLAALQHVKRVRKSTRLPGKLDIVLCPAPPSSSSNGGSRDLGNCSNGGDRTSTEGGVAEERDPGNGSAAVVDDQLQSQLPNEVASLVQEHGLELFIGQVSRHAPKTREQALQWGQHWPLSWRPPDPSAHPQHAELPAPEIAAMKRHMTRVWELAQGNAAHGAVQNACLIVNPATGRVVAEAVDERHRHPLHHATMQAVAAVAAWQQATWPGAGRKHGAPPPQQQQEQGQLAGGEGGGGQQQQQGPGGEQRGQQQACTGPPDALESKRRRVEGAGDVQAGSSSDVATAGQEQGRNEAGGDDSSCSEKFDRGPRPYLCTGYDCYLVHEPCAMCAMALVHSRLRRVVFSLSDPAGGALGGSGVRLHGQRSINHKYTVYRLAPGRSSP